MNGARDYLPSGTASSLINSDRTDAWETIRGSGNASRLGVGHVLLANRRKQAELDDAPEHMRGNVWATGMIAEIFLKFLLAAVRRNEARLDSDPGHGEHPLGGRTLMISIKAGRAQVTTGQLRDGHFESSTRLQQVNSAAKGFPAQRCVPLADSGGTSRETFDIVRRSRSFITSEKCRATRFIAAPQCGFQNSSECVFRHTPSFRARSVSSGTDCEHRSFRHLR